MDNAKVRVTDSQRFKEMDKHTENWEMIKETEIKTNERTNKQTDKQLDKKPQHKWHRIKQEYIFRWR